MTIKTLIPKEWISTIGSWDAYSSNGAIDMGSISTFYPTDFIDYIQGDPDVDSTVYDTYVHDYDSNAGPFSVTFSMGDGTTGSTDQILDTTNNVLSIWYNNSNTSGDIQYSVYLYAGPNSEYVSNLGTLTATGNVNGKNTIQLATADINAINTYGIDTIQIEIDVRPVVIGGYYLALSLAAASLDLESVTYAESAAPTIDESSLTPVANYLSQENTVQFQATLTDPDAYELLALEVQYTQDQSFITGITNMQGSGVNASASNVGVAASVTSGSMASGRWYWRARAVDRGGLTSPWTIIRMLTIDYDVKYTETLASDFSTGTLVNVTGANNSLTLINQGTGGTYNYYTSGSKTTVAIDLSSAKLYKNSNLSYSANTPASTAVSFQTSLDSGSTWQDIAQGGSISGLTNMQNLTGRSILVRVNMSTTNTTQTPTLMDFTLDVYGIDQPIPYGTLNASATIGVSPYWYHIPVSLSGYANSNKASATVSAAPTISSAPPTIGTRTPANNTTVTSASTTLYATITDAYSGASSVDFQIANDINFSTNLRTYTVTGVASGTQASQSVSASVGDNYWRVRATNAKGITSNWSSPYGLYYRPSDSRYSPIAINTQTNLTGSLSSIQEDPDTPDANWLTASSKAQSILNVSFPAPPAPLLSGAGQQEFRVQVRPSSAISGGTVTIALYDSTTQETISSSYSIGTAATILSFTWDASLLSSPSSGNVRAQITGNGVYSGKSTSQYAIEIGAVEWNYKLNVSAQNTAPNGVTYSAYANGTIKSVVDAKASWVRLSGNLSSTATTNAYPSIASTNKEVYSNLRSVATVNINASPSVVVAVSGGSSVTTTVTAVPTIASSLFFTDFSSYPSGAVPSDWSPIWVTSTANWQIGNVPQAIDGKALTDASITVDGRRAITWNKAGNVSGDFDMVMKWYSTDATSGNIPARMLAFASGNETQTTQNGYTLDVLFPSTIRIGATQGGTYGTLISLATAPTMTLNTWYWMRFRRIGTTLYGKVWQDGQAEPGSFQVQIADTKFSSGPVGIGSYDFNGDRYYDEFDVAINGTSIPYPTTVTLSGYGNLNASATAVAAPYESHPNTDYLAYGDLHSSVNVVPRPWASGMPVDHTVSANANASAMAAVVNASQTRPAYTYESSTANSVVSVTNFTPSDSPTVLSYLADGLDGPTDANVLTSTVQTIAPSVELKFPTPSGTLAGLQTVNVTFVDPSYYGILIKVKENGTVIYTSPASYVQAANRHASFQFDASLLSDKTGASMSIIVAGQLYQSHTINTLNAVQYVASLDAGTLSVPPLLNELPTDNTLNSPTSIFPLDGAGWKATVARAVVSSVDGQPVKLRVKYSKTSDFASFYVQESDSFVASGSEATINLTGIPFADGDTVYWQALSATSTGQSTYTNVFSYLYRPLGDYDIDRFMQQGNDTMMKVIDVSEYQGTVDWNQVKSSGVDYAILRVYGSNAVADTNFVANAANSKTAGVKTGGYYFAMPSVPLDLAQARSEADKFANQLQVGYGTGNYGDLLPVLDLEDNSTHTAAGQTINDLSVTDMLSWAQEFRSHFESTTNVRLMLYTVESFVHTRNQFNADPYTGSPKAGTTGNPLKDMPVWVAALTTYDRYRGFAMPLFGGWMQWNMWQYANTTHPNIQGVTGDLDQTITQSMDWALTSNPDNVITSGKISYGTLTAKATVDAIPTKDRTATDWTTNGTLNASASVDGKGTVSRTASDYLVYVTATGIATVQDNANDTRTANDYLVESSLNASASVVSNPQKTRTASDWITHATPNASAIVDAKSNVSRTASDLSANSTLSTSTSVDGKAVNNRTAFDINTRVSASAIGSTIANAQRIRTATDWTVKATLTDSSTMSGSVNVQRTANDLSAYAILKASSQTTNAPSKTRTAMDYQSSFTVNAKATSDAEPTWTKTATDCTSQATISSDSSTDGKPTIQRTASDYLINVDVSGYASTGSAPAVTRTAADYSSHASLNGRATVTSVPQKARTAADTIVYAHLNASTSLDSEPDKIRTATDWISQSSISAQATVEGDGNVNNTATVWSAHGNLNSSARTGAMSNVTRTANDFQSSATLSGSARTDSISQDNRTALDMSVSATLSGTSSATGRPSSVRTAQDFVSYSHDSGASTVIKASPSIARTASDLTAKSTVSSQSTVDGKPTSVRTASDLQGHGTLSSQATGIAKAVSSRTASDYLVHGTLSGKATSSSQPTDARTANDYGAHSLDMAVGTIAKASPNISRTASDWTTKASVSSGTSVDGLASMNTTANVFLVHGTLSVKATVVSNPTKIRTASDWTPRATLRPLGTVSASPTKVRTANDFSARSTESASATVSTLRPSLIRTASSYSVYAKSITAKATVYSAPSKIRTAADWTPKGTLSASANITGNGLDTHTSRNYTAQASILGIATADGKPAQTIAQSYLAYGYLSPKATVDGKPINEITSSTHASASATVDGKPTVARTAKDLSANAHFSAGATIHGKPLNSFTASIWITNGRPKASATVEIVSSPTVTRTAGNYTAGGTSNASGTASANPSVSRTAKDYSVSITIKSSAKADSAPTKIRTAKDIIAYAASTGQSIVIVNPVVIKYDPNGFSTLKAKAIAIAKPTLIRFNTTYVAIQRVQTANGFIELPIYPLGSFGYEALRISYGDGLIGCYELVDPDDATSIRIETPQGTKGIRTL